MADKMAPGSVIFINGYPGVGKTAIALELEKMVGTSKVVILDHNEIMDRPDAPGTVEPPTYKSKLGDALLDHVFKEDDKTIIVLEYLHDSDDSHNHIAQSYKTAAAVSNRPFHSIYLACDAVENVRRNRTLNRRTAIGKAKQAQSDQFLWREIARNRPIRFGKDCHSVDVTMLSARKAAKAVLDHVQNQGDGVKVTPGEGQDKDWMVVSKP